MAPVFRIRFSLFIESLKYLEDDIKIFGVYDVTPGRLSLSVASSLYFVYRYSFHFILRFLKAAGGYRDWPSGRGIFFNDDKTFLVWVNEEDHLRIISMQKGGDLGAIYTRLVNVSTFYKVDCQPSSRPYCCIWTSLYSAIFGLQSFCPLLAIHPISVFEGLHPLSSIAVPVVIHRLRWPSILLLV
jgi:hypothetical protein